MKSPAPSDPHPPAICPPFSQKRRHVQGGLFSSASALFFFAIFSAAGLPPASGAPAAAAQTPAVVFVGGPDAPANAAGFAAAFARLPNGGSIVLRGPVRLGENFSTPVHEAPVTLTSVHDGRDYRDENGARLITGGSYTINGPTTFASLVIAPDDKAGRIHCNGHKTVFAGGVSCEPPPGGRFPAIIGAAREAGGPSGSDVTINSGEWDTVAGGTFQDAAPTSGTLRMTINGGRFHGAVCAAGTGRHTGGAELTLNNGVFFGGVSVLGNHAGASVRGDVRVTINGGTFHNTITASRNAGAEFAGSFALALNGGNFVSLTGVTGARGLRGGAASSLAAAPALLDAENSGELTFTNPLIPGADPWVFFHDGFYYCTATGGSQLNGRKVANLPDLPHAGPVTLWRPPPGRDYSRNLWSPKIYQFTEAEVGAENAGWYLYLSANDGTGRPSQGQRMFVLRSLSGGPLGPYGAANGNREPNGATRVSAAAKDSAFNTVWCGGAKILKHDGKIYCIYVSEVGDKFSKKTGDRYQIICIDRLVNPWTVEGRPAIINRPTLAWEKHGAGPGKAGMYPEVVEGGTPVRAADGSLYLLYAASGYWTPYYAIGVMRLKDGGDPMDPAHWQKATQPIFKASDEVVGTGNACYAPSPTGKSNWAIYHAYVGKKTGGVPRHLFAEPYLANNKGVTIGRGTPLPLGTPLKIEANPMPLRKKISGFTGAH
ncbi:MAG: family 43 glycosylhydrolase [Opitutaceae bacterium]|jgi:GH43 family beta-xylosidase|nr:family 43 glycosylhydrolase [Opitutaceae bacterium]